MEKFVKISRYDDNIFIGSYIQPIKDILSTISAEFDEISVQDKLILEIIEMTQDQYNNLPEFTGY